MPPDAEAAPAVELRLVVSATRGSVADCSPTTTATHLDTPMIAPRNAAALGMVLLLLSACASPPTPPGTLAGLSPVPTAPAASAASSVPVATPRASTPAAPLASTPAAAPASASPGAPAGSPSPTPAPDASGTATRIVVESLGIDLPVVTLPSSGVHYCGVAMRWPYRGFVEPGQAGSVYVLAHARVGMFLPLLDASQRSGGRSLVGRKVLLYTSADWVFTYDITKVQRHVPSADVSRLSAPLAARDAELWMQTSEGATTASPLLQVAATLVEARPASHSASHPIPRPWVCG